MQEGFHAVQLHMTFVRAVVLGFGVGLGLLLAWSAVILAALVLIGAAVSG